MSDSQPLEQDDSRCEQLDRQAVADTLEPDLIIITGMSGAGRTEAVHTFEDLGYYCIDNLPPNLLVSLVSLATIPGQNKQSRRLAVVCDARNQDFFFDLFNELAHLKDAGLTYRIIFLDASDECLLARYKASRRRHPLCNRSMTVTQGIARERKLLSKVREAANSLIDTSDQKPRELRDRLRSLFAEESEREGLSVIVYSFGFKHGAPIDADIVIDVRFLPNPFYEPELRCLTGLDEPVKEYVMQRFETKDFLERWTALLACIMPGYVNEGKQQLAIAIGCTGGQHRSVALAEATGAFLLSEGYSVSVAHRDIALAETVVEKR
ncbi:MAG: RNase adapter RapZ [Raoultibacter sp.]